MGTLLYGIILSFFLSHNGITEQLSDVEKSDAYKLGQLSILKKNLESFEKNFQDEIEFQIKKFGCITIFFGLITIWASNSLRKTPHPKTSGNGPIYIIYTIGFGVMTLYTLAQTISLVKQFKKIVNKK